MSGRNASEYALSESIIYPIVLPLSLFIQYLPNCISHIAFHVTLSIGFITYLLLFLPFPPVPSLRSILEEGNEECRQEREEDVFYTLRYRRYSGVHMAERICDSRLSIPESALGRSVQCLSRMFLAT